MIFIKSSAQGSDCLPDLVSNVTTNTATIWSFSSHWSLADRNGTVRSVPRDCPQSTVCGRPELPSPPATTAVPHLVGLQVMAVDLLLHPVPVSVAARRPDACELFCGSAPSSRGREGGGGGGGGGGGHA